MPTPRHAARRTRRWRTSRRAPRTKKPSGDVASPDALPVSGLLGHRVLDHSGNQHDYDAAYARRGDVADHAAAASPAGTQCIEDRRTGATTDDTGNRVAQSAEAQVLEHRSGNIAADRTRHQANDPLHHVPLLIVVLDVTCSY